MSAKADLALAYLSQNKFKESETLAREVFSFIRTKPPDDWTRFRAESLLGASLTGQRKYDEAEPLLLEGYRGMAERKERIAVPNHYYLDQAGKWDRPALSGVGQTRQDDGVAPLTAVRLFNRELSSDASGRLAVSPCAHLQVSSIARRPRSAGVTASVVI